MIPGEFVVDLLYIFGLFVPIAWFIRSVRLLLFYLYLWQLKEYHVGRFVAHFQTEKGRTLLSNKVVRLKSILILVFFGFLVLSFLDSRDVQIPDMAGLPLFGLLSSAFVVLVLLYIVEITKVGSDFLRRKVKRPILTNKTTLLFMVGIGGIAFYVYFLIYFTNYMYLLLRWDLFTSLFLFPVGLLAFDILLPAFVSLMVLSLQPLTVAGRAQILLRAKKKRRKMKSLKVIGITGSYGKTTTKEILAHILSAKYNVVKTPKHANSEVGIAQSILRNVTDVHDIFVCEMGAYNKGGIQLLAGIAKPDIAIVTGVNQQHLATFKSMESLLSAEGGEELIRALPKDGVAIMNGHSRTLLESRATLESLGRKVKWISLNKGALQAERIRVGKDNIEFSLIDENNRSAHVQVPMLGTHNIENILLAANCAKEVGMKFEEIAKALETLPRESSPVRLRKSVDGLNIADSSYSANPNGVIADLEYLRAWKGKRVVVMPCLIELGEAAKEVHENIGKKIGEICDIAIITSEEYFENIQDGAEEYGAKEGQVLFRENPQEVFGTLRSFNKEEDIILLGGRVPEKLMELLFRS